MTTTRPRRLTATLTAAALALTALLPGAVSADPAVPRFVITEQTDQAGTFDPGHGAFNSAWFTLAIANDGTSTYTQMHLTVIPNDPTVVARAAIDAASPTLSLSSICTTVGNGFDCVWPTNLGGGQTTSPITFIFGAPNGEPYDVEAFFQTKDHTTTSGGGSGQDRDVSENETISVNVSDRIDRQTPYLLPTTSSITVSTYKKNGVAALTLPASGSGYLIDLEETSSTPGACVFDAAYAWSLSAKAFVNHGATVSPYIKWKSSVIWDNKDGSQGTGAPPAGYVAPSGVTHCVDNGDGTFSTYTISVKCTNQAPLGPDGKGCIESSSVQVKGNKSTNLVVVTYTVNFRTPSNGYTKPTRG